MILTGFLVAFVGLSLSQAAAESSEEEIPLLIASQGDSDDAKVSNLLPDLGEPDLSPLTYAQSPANKGRSDIEIEDDQPPRGYFYPKPSKAFNLPAFKTLDANAPLGGGIVSFAQETREIERLPRQPYFLSRRDMHLD